MSMAVSVEAAEQDLKNLLERLRFGETITFVNSDGAPLAILVSLKSVKTESQPVSDWKTRWNALAEKVSCAWKDERSAIEALKEMRR